MAVNLEPMCQSGKLGYVTPADANRALDAIVNHRHRRPKQWMRQSKPVAYKCPMCSEWHVSSGTKPTGRPA